MGLGQCLKPDSGASDTFTIVALCKYSSEYGFWGSRFERAFFDVRVFNDETGKPHFHQPIGVTSRKRKGDTTRGSEK